MSFLHGGQLERIKQYYPEQTLPWVDLSTGISPFSYPVDVNIEARLQSLPQQYTELTQAACEYYGAENTLVVPGSMWAIQTLPLIRSQLAKGDVRPVMLPNQGFNEHAKAWQSWGFNIERYNSVPTKKQLNRAQACVVINPNNPTGFLMDKDQLALMHQILQSNDAWLVVDEAFLDLAPEVSVASIASTKGLLVLKSFGKFFGLPGLRVGALIADTEITHYAQKMLNEWTINSAAQKIATCAWRDTAWQQDAQHSIKDASTRFNTLLSRLGLSTQGSDLFQTLMTSQAVEFYQFLLQQGIYVRLLDDENGIRIGLPKQTSDWQRLEHAIIQFLEK